MRSFFISCRKKDNGFKQTRYNCVTHSQVGATVFLYGDLSSILIQVDLCHIIQNATNILSHGNVRIPIHPPIITPLIPHNPVPLPIPRILAVAIGLTPLTPALIVVFSVLLRNLVVIFLIPLPIGKHVPHRLHTMIHIKEPAPAAAVGGDDPSGVIHPGGRVEADGRRAVGCHVLDGRDFILGIAVAAAPVGVADASFRGISVPLDLTVPRG
mmetsp:Transcript_59665/g.71689  ORF Transcript_59665/g.71689 Transcript_59665/m.71689 type:complete len:212 (-) Transcript_59665:819-1454(-)